MFWSESDIKNFVNADQTSQEAEGYTASLYPENTNTFVMDYSDNSIKPQLKIITTKEQIQDFANYIKTGESKYRESYIIGKGSKPIDAVPSFERPLVKYIFTPADLNPNNKTWLQEGGEVVKAGVQFAVSCVAVDAIGSLVGAGGAVVIPILGWEKIASLAEPILKIGADLVDSTPFLKTASTTGEYVLASKILPFIPADFGGDIALGTAAKRVVTGALSKDTLAFTVANTATEVGSDVLAGKPVDLLKTVREQTIQNMLMFGFLPPMLHATGYTLKGGGSLLANMGKVAAKTELIAPAADWLATQNNHFKNWFSEQLFFGIPLEIAKKANSFIFSLENWGAVEKNIASLNKDVPQLLKDENFNTIRKALSDFADMKYANNPEEDVSSLMVLEAGRLYSFMKEAPDLYNKHIELYANNQYQNIIRKYPEEFKKLTELFPDIFSFNRKSVSEEAWKHFLLSPHGGGFVYGLNRDSVHLIKSMMGKPLTENALEKIKELIPSDKQAELVYNNIKEITTLRDDIISFLDSGLPKSIPSEMHMDLYKAKQETLKSFKSGKTNWAGAAQFWREFADKMASTQIDSKISEIDSLLKESVDNAIINNRLRVSRYYLKGSENVSPDEGSNVFEFKRTRVDLYTKATKKRVYQTILDRAIADPKLMLSDSANLTKTLLRGDNEARFYSGIIDMLENNPGRRMIFEKNLATTVDISAKKIADDVSRFYDKVSFGGENFYIEKNTVKFLNQQGNLLFGNNSAMIDQNFGSRFISTAKMFKTSLSIIHFAALSNAAFSIGESGSLAKAYSVLFSHLGASGTEYINKEIYDNIDYITNFSMKNKEKLGDNATFDTLLTNIMSSEEFRMAKEFGFTKALRKAPLAKQVLDASLFLEDTLWNKFVPLLKTNVAKQIIEKGEAVGRDPKAILEDLKKISDVFGGQSLWQYMNPRANMWLRVFTFAPDWYLTLAKHATRSLSGDEMFSVFYARALSIRMLMNNALSIAFTGKSADERFSETHDIRDLGRFPIRVETVSSNGRITKKVIYLDAFGFETEGLELIPILPFVEQIIKNANMIKNPSTTVLGIQKTIMGTLDDTMKFYMSKGGIAMQLITPIIQHKNSNPFISTVGAFIGSFVPIGGSGFYNVMKYKVEPQTPTSSFVAPALLFALTQAGMRMRTSEKIGEEAYAKWMTTTTLDQKLNGDLGPVVTNWYIKNSKLFGDNPNANTIKKQLYSKLVQEYYGISVKDIRKADPTIRKQIVNRIIHDPTLLTLVKRADPSL